MPDQLPSTDIRPAISGSMLDAKPTLTNVPEGDFNLNDFLGELTKQPEQPERPKLETGDTAQPTPPIVESKPQKNPEQVKAEILASFNDVSPEAVAESVLRGAISEIQVYLPENLTRDIDDLTHRYAFGHAGVDGKDARAAGDARTAMYTLHRDSGREPSLEGVTATLRTLRINQEIVNQTGERLLRLRDVLSGNIGAVLCDDLRADLGTLDEAARIEITDQYTRQTADDLAQIAISSLEHPEAWGAGLAIAHLPQVSERTEIKQAVAKLFVQFKGESDSTGENSRFNRAIRTRSRLIGALSDKGIVIGRARVRIDTASDNKSVRIDLDENPHVANAGQVITETTNTLSGILREQRGNPDGVKNQMRNAMARQRNCAPFNIAWSAGSPPEIKSTSM